MDIWKYEHEVTRVSTLNSAQITFPNSGVTPCVLDSLRWGYLYDFLSIMRSSRMKHHEVGRKSGSAVFPFLGTPILSHTNIRSGVHVLHTVKWPLGSSESTPRAQEPDTVMYGVLMLLFQCLTASGGVHATAGPAGRYSLDVSHNIGIKHMSEYLHWCPECLLIHYFVYHKTYQTVQSWTSSFCQWSLFQNHYPEKVDRCPSTLIGIAPPRLLNAWFAKMKVFKPPKPSWTPEPNTERFENASVMTVVRVASGSKRRVLSFPIAVKHDNLGQKSKILKAVVS